MLSDIPDDHPIRAFVIETGNLKDGFQIACEHIATLEAKLSKMEETRELLDDAGVEHSGRTLPERVSELIEERDSVRKILIRNKAVAGGDDGIHP